MTRLAALLILILFAAQEASEARHNGGRFLKRIENNYTNSIRVIEKDGSVHGMYNLDSKSEMEKRFFGDFNAPVEFFIAPPFEGSSGFRLYRDSTGGWVLEAKRMTNCREAEEELTKDSPLMRLSADTPERYRIEARSIGIGDTLAQRIYDCTTRIIDRHTGGGYPDMVFDGEQITFRCVVGYDLWTLTLHAPRDNKAAKAAELYRRLIDDIQAGGPIDEKQYIDWLDLYIPQVDHSLPHDIHSAQNSRRHSRQ